MGTTPPVAEPDVTHGICPDCLERLAREDRRIRGRALIIVQRSRVELRDRLEGIYAGFDDVTVRMDQRVGERRQVRVYAGPERRRGDRRRPLFPSQAAAWLALGVVVTL